MKKTILPLLMAAFFTQANAQQNKAYAITGEIKGSYSWTAVREIDLSNGAIVKTLYAPQQNKNINYAFINSDARAIATQQNNWATANGVAAAAYDAKNNRLYFTPMWGTDLRYFDLNSSEVAVVVNNDTKFSTGARVDESNILTRMVIAADGNGYALTNDGKQLIQFTTDKVPVITNLGTLVDGKNNHNISVHTQCTSWGGDMIADVYGNLYLITYRNHIFKINPATKVADYIGAIKNLPANFTTNGAAVDNEGNIVVSSSTQTENYYSVNISTLQATPLVKADATVYNASDLASANLLYQNSRTNLTVNTIQQNHVISVYPNPAVNKNFAVRFDKLPKGNYTIELSDVNGRRVMNRVFSLNGTQNENISLSKGTASGAYLIRVLNSNGEVMFTDKVMVQ